MPRLSVDDAKAATRRLEALLDEDRTFTVSTHQALAISVYTRARGLLRSLRVLVSENEPAACGLIVRALYEEHLVSSLVVDGEDSDRERLMLDFVYWAERHAKEWDKAPPERDPSIKPKSWDPLDRAKRVDTIHGDTSATDWYRDLYRVESFGSVHAGYASSARHVVADDQPDTFQVVNMPETSGEVAARLLVGLILVANIARNAWHAGGFDLTPIDEIIEPLGQLVFAEE
jgi:hypothetical protein